MACPPIVCPIIRLFVGPRTSGSRTVGMPLIAGGVDMRRARRPRIVRRAKLCGLAAMAAVCAAMPLPRSVARLQSDLR